MVRQPAIREGLHKPMAFGPIGLAKLKLTPIYGVPERVNALHAYRVGNYGKF